MTISSNSGRLPANLQYDEVDEVYDILKQRFDGELDEEKLMDGLKRGLAEASGDNHTTYWNSKEAELNEGDLNGEFPGIGAELEHEGGRPVVVAPIEDTPADKAGIRSKDIIISVDGQDTGSMSLTEAVSKIRGEKGTEVKLEILREDQKIDLSIVRDIIKTETVKTKLLAEGKVGYLRLTQFGEKSFEEAKGAAQELKNKGVSSVVFDLRDNPGGSLPASVDIAGLWLRDKTIVEQKRGGKTVDTLKSSTEPVLEGVPTVVLINQGSASASEIVAAALDDYQVAELFGETTYGKGSVQELSRLDGGGVLKVTVARWFTPNGKNVDKEGIRPDTQISDDLNTEADEALEKAISHLIEKAGG